MSAREGQVSRSALGETDRPNLLGKKRIPSSEMSLLLYCFMCHSYSKGNEMTPAYDSRAPLWRIVISKTYYLAAIELGLLLILRSLKRLVCSTKALQILKKRYQSQNKRNKLIKELMCQWKWSEAGVTFNTMPISGIEKKRTGNRKRESQMVCNRSLMHWTRTRQKWMFLVEYSSVGIGEQHDFSVQYISHVIWSRLVITHLFLLHVAN